MREDVYQSLLKYKAKGEQLGPVDQRRTILAAREPVLRSLVVV